MKVAVIGNSHAAAWKMGWDRIAARHPGISMTFFAQGRQQILALQVRDGRLEPGNDKLRNAIVQTSGGQAAVAPDLYDVFLVCGLYNFSLRSVDRPEFSRAVWEALVTDTLRASGAHEMAGKLRAITDKPVFLAPNPLPALQDPGHPPARVPMSERVRLCNEAVLAALDTVMTEQPAETIDGGIATRPEFARGAVGTSQVDGGGMNQADDGTHMNADYGVVAIEAFLDRVRAAWPPS